MKISLYQINHASEIKDYLVWNVEHDPKKTREFILTKDINSALIKLYKSDSIEKHMVLGNSDWKRPDGLYDYGIFYEITNNIGAVVYNMSYDYISINNKYNLFIDDKGLTEEDIATNFIHFLATQEAGSMYKRILHNYMYWFNTFFEYANKIFNFIDYNSTEFSRFISAIIFKEILNNLYADHPDKNLIEKQLDSFISKFKKKIFDIKQIKENEINIFLKRIKKDYDKIEAKLRKCLNTNSFLSSPKEVQDKLKQTVEQSFVNYINRNYAVLIRDFIHYAFRRFFDSCSTKFVLTEINIKENRKLYLKKYFFKIRTKIELVNCLLLIMSDEMKIFRPLDHYLDHYYDTPEFSSKLKYLGDFKNLSVKIKYKINCNKKEILASVIKVGFIGNRKEYDYLETKSIIKESISLIAEKAAPMFVNKLVLNIFSIESKKLIDRYIYLTQLVRVYGYDVVCPTMIFNF